MRINKIFALLLTCLLLAGGASARSRKKTPRSGHFSYYLLSLSYAPDFCAQPTGNKDPRECGSGRHVGFVVHGLWPQGENGRGPENCGSASPVAQDIVRSMLTYIPTESLIQHEWATHGTCTGLSSADYFALVRKARDLVKIPADLQAPSRELQFGPTAIEAKLATANPAFPKGTFRISCYRDAELQESTSLPQQRSITAGVRKQRRPLFCRNGITQAGSLTDEGELLLRALHPFEDGSRNAIICRVGREHFRHVAVILKHHHGRTILHHAKLVLEDLVELDHSRQVPFAGA